MGPLEQEVADDAADQVELVPGQAEAFAELRGDGGDLEERAGVATRPVGHDRVRIPLRRGPLR